MNKHTYWISDVNYDTDDVTLKIVDIDTWQSCYLGLNDNKQLQNFLPYFEKTDLDLLEHLRKLDSTDDLQYNLWISAVNYLETGISVNVMDIETGQVWPVGLHEEQALAKFIPYFKPADLALIERLKLMDKDSSRD